MHLLFAWRTAMMMSSSLPTAPSAVNQAYTFARIPIREAARHIHCPEQAIVAHGLQPPGFALRAVHPPRHVLGYDAVDFDYETCLGGGRAVLFTNDPFAAHLLFFETDRSSGNQTKPHFIAMLRARPAGHTGHTLTVTTQFLTPPTALERLCLPWQRCGVSKGSVRNALEHTPGARVPVRPDAHPHLQTYRWRVLVAPLMMMSLEARSRS